MTPAPRTSKGQMSNRRAPSQPVRAAEIGGIGPGRASCSKNPPMRNEPVCVDATAARQTQRCSTAGTPLGFIRKGFPAAAWGARPKVRLLLNTLTRISSESGDAARTADVQGAGLLQSAIGMSSDDDDGSLFIVSNKYGKII